jgi:hypothetical protein
MYKLLRNLEWENILSLGDWKTTSGSTIYLENDGGIVTDTVDFSAKNVHVGDAAQVQYSGSLRYEFIKGLYIKPRLTYFAKNYANFSPITLTGNNRDRESWKMPNYGLLDIYAGYNFNYWKMSFGVYAAVVNVLDKVYISDANNGYDFDATSATVFMGLGRRINFGLSIGF